MIINDLLISIFFSRILAKFTRSKFCNQFINKSLLKWVRYNTFELCFRDCTVCFTRESNVDARFSSIAISNTNAFTPSACLFVCFVGCLFGLFLLDK